MRYHRSVRAASAIALPASVFRRALPLLFTTFVNKCGAIGLSLLPMLLIERRVTDGDASLALGVVKTALVVGMFAGGFLSDRVGLKSTLIASFLLSGLGLGLLPSAETLLTVVVLAAAAQAGQSMFAGPSRLLVTGLVGLAGEREAIGWLRMALNCGSIVSFSIGAALTSSALYSLMLLDSVTSLAAAAVGLRLLPDDERPFESARAKGEAAFPARASWGLFGLCAFVAFGFSFLYDLYIVSASAQFRDRFGEDGLKLFSQVMVANTVLCTAFSVVASRALRDPASAFPAGLILVAAGAALGLSSADSRALIFAGALLFTVGEIVFAALSGFVLLRVTPHSPRRGSAFGAALVVQSLGRIAGSAAAFPMVVHGSHPTAFVLGAATVFVAASLVAGPALRRFFAAQDF